MNILITGGTGFIGSHVLRHLLHNGYNVILSTVSPYTAVTAGSIPVRVIHGSLFDLDPRQLGSIDAVIHLAATGVSPRHATWSELEEVNIRGTLHMCQLAKTLCSRLIIAGSYAEYGLSGLRYEKIPASAPLEPTSSYAVSKAAACQLALGFARSEAIEMAYLRIFNAFGQGQHGSNLWPSLMKAAVSGEDFEMTPGEQIRDFIDVDHIAFRFVELALSSKLLSGKPLVVNVASGKPQTVRQFCEYWWIHSKAAGSLRIGGIPYRANEVMRYVPSLDAVYL